MKGAQFGAKRMTLSTDQVLNLQISLHWVWMPDQPSGWVCGVFNLLCGPLRLECSSRRRGGGGVCFGREHFLLFLSGTVWYAALLYCDNTRLVVELKAGFVYTNSTEDTKVHEKLLLLLQLSNLTLCPARSESYPQSSELKVQTWLKTNRTALWFRAFCVCLWVRQLPVKCDAVYTPELESVWNDEVWGWWSAMIRALWVQRASSSSSIEPANEATASPHHLTACWFIHSPHYSWRGEFVAIRLLQVGSCCMN